jgi:hypothetical protein
MKAPDLFAISAFILLGFKFLIRFINATPLGISIAWRGTGYVIPPEAISVAMATLLCFYATAYSLWMLPFNRGAMLVHFWLTAIGIAVFWFSFLAPNLMESKSNIAIWTVFLVPIAVLFAQLVFVWNVFHAIVNMPRPHS